jgi:hypothetical protein
MVDVAVMGIIVCGFFFEKVRHDRPLAKVAQRVDDADVTRLLGAELAVSARRCDVAAAYPSL